MYQVYQQPVLMLIPLAIVGIWVLIWKGLSLWYAAKNHQKAWFIVLLVTNTLGLLPILYLIWFQKKNKEKKNKNQNLIEEFSIKLKENKKNKNIKNKIKLHKNKK